MIRTYTNTLHKQKKLLKYVADNLCEQNLEEAKIIFGDIKPLDLLIGQAVSTVTGFVVFDAEGNPRGMGGINADHSVWFVLTEGCSRVEYVPWLKAGHTWFKEQLAVWRNLWGYCLKENTLSMKWMKWLGFDFAAEDTAATWIYNGRTFLYFQKTE